MLGGVVLNGIATGAYIGAGLGPGPRDGLMTGLAARGHSIRVVRTSIELTVLVTGWLLGGTVGVGTVVYALAIGPIAHVTIPRLRIPLGEPAAAGGADYRWRSAPASRPFAHKVGVRALTATRNSRGYLLLGAVLNRHERRQHAQNAHRRGSRVAWLRLTRARDHLGEPSGAGFGRRRPAGRHDGITVERRPVECHGQRHGEPERSVDELLLQVRHDDFVRASDHPSRRRHGTGTVAVHQTLDGLTPNTTYHYQLVATSSAGTTNSTDQTFTTSATATSQTVVLGHEGFVSPGSVVGAEVGCFHGTTTCTGQLTMTHNGTTIAQRNYSIDARQRRVPEHGAELDRAE